MRELRSVSLGLLILVILAAPLHAASSPATAGHTHEPLLEMHEHQFDIPRGVTSPRYRRSVVDDSGGRAIAHLAGGKPIKGLSGGPTARLHRIGVGAGEPTLGVTKDGTLFYQAFDGPPIVMRSRDGARTWKDVSPMTAERRRHPNTLDPYLYVDPMTDRVFTYDFFFGCSELSFTDDLGETWTTTVVNCGLMDHQNLFAGPPMHSPTAGYPNIVYSCSTQFGATIYSVAAQCLKSLDGGITSTPTGEPVFASNPQDENDLGVPAYCHGAIGHGFVGQDGTVYIPKGFCGQPWLAISHDEGATWTRVQVADNGVPQTATGVYEHETAVAADAKGNVYYFWLSAKRLPYLAISRDEGETWGKPIMIGPPGIKEATLPKIDVGAPGKIAVAYYGSENSPGPPFPQADDCKPDPVSCFRALFFLNPPDPESYRKVTWNSYITASDNVLDADPVFYTGTINDPRDPLVRGTCGPIRCKAVYDFIDIVIDRKGRPWSALVDICLDACSKPGATDNMGNEAVVGTLTGGPPLR